MWCKERIGGEWIWDFYQEVIVVVYRKRVGSLCYSDDDGRIKV